MDIFLLYKGVNNENEKIYYLILDSDDRNILNVPKLTEKELKEFSKIIYTKVNKLLNR